MAIKIDNMPRSQVLQRGKESELKSSPNEAVSRQQMGTPVPTGDKVSLSKSASNLLEILNSVSSMPVVDTKHVAEIKLALNKGSYEIDAESTAQKLIDMEQKLY